MSLTMAIIVLSLSIGVSIILILFYTIWQQQRVDIARQKLFIARDKIFVAFVESDLGVDHPCHRALRHSLNRMIRHAHRITWFRVALYATLAKMPKSRELSDEVRTIQEHSIYADVRKHISSAYDAVIELMITRSMPLSLSWVIVVMINALHNKWHQMRGSAETAADSIFAMAEKEEEAAILRRRSRGMAKAA